MSDKVLFSPIFELSLTQKMFTACGYSLAGL